MKDDTTYQENENASVAPLEVPESQKTESGSDEEYTQEDIDAFKWVNLPDGTPATAIAFYDNEGNAVELEEAKTVVAADVYLNLFQFNVREDTFNKPRLH